MRRAFLLLAVCLLVAPAARAVDLGTISLGFHLMPAVERQEERRAWGLSLSLGVEALVGTSDSVELTIVVDSIPSSLGATFMYLRDLSDPFSVGAGLNVLWRFETEATLIRTVIGGFACASARVPLLPSFSGEAGLSFPLIAFARGITEWEVLPLAELPSLQFGGEWQGLVGAAVEGRLTLQPVVIDTTRLIDPVGRLSDRLLVLPTYSLFLRYAR